MRCSRDGCEVKQLTGIVVHTAGGRDTCKRLAEILRMMRIGIRSRK
jgi:hypothetical protein